MSVIIRHFFSNEIVIYISFSHKFDAHVQAFILCLNNVLILWNPVETWGQRQGRNSPSFSLSFLYSAIIFLK